jgi:hypothetical protein
MPPSRQSAVAGRLGFRSGRNSREIRWTSIACEPMEGFSVRLRKATSKPNPVIAAFYISTQFAKTEDADRALYGVLLRELARLDIAERWPRPRLGPGGFICAATVGCAPMVQAGRRAAIVMIRTGRSRHWRPQHADRCRAARPASGPVIA